MRKKPSQSPVRRAGFTLLEVLVAFAIMVTVLVAAYQGYASTFLIQSTTADLWVMMNQVHDELSRMERAVSNPPGKSEGTYPDGHPLAGATWVRTISDEMPVPGITVRRIKLRVNWNAPGHHQSYEAEIYVAAN